MTTVTFEEKGDKTLLVLHELYPSKEALDEAIAGWRVGCPNSSSNWTSFSSPWARAWDGHEVVDLAVGRLALHYAEEKPDEVVAALDDKTEALLRELEAQHKEARRSLRRRRRPTADLRSHAVGQRKRCVQGLIPRWFGAVSVHKYS